MHRSTVLPVLLVLLLTSTFHQSVQSQILYKVNFHDKNNASYEGLMVYFNESRAYLRVGYYTAGNKYHVVNVDYKSSNGTYYDGSSYFFMSGSNPKFITANPDKFTYNPDYFIWRKGANEMNWKQPSTSDDPKLNVANEIPVDSFYQLNPYTITETFLRKFFWNNESEFFALKKLCGLTVTTTPTINTNGAKLHLIVVANTVISDIGPSCVADRDKLDYEFKSIAEALGVGYAKYIVDGDNFNKTTVQSTLNNFTCGTNDIIVFVYRGHGFRWDNQTDIYPMMDLRTNGYAVAISKNTSLGLSEVYTTLKNKGARLSLILADCCNNKVGISQTTTFSFLNSQADNKPDISKLKKLFMTSRGTLISAAARSGEYSWANPFGGFYTLSFLQAMKEKISYLNNGTYSWNDIITYTTKLAKDKSSPALCSNCTLQTGVSYVNVSY